MKTHSLVALSLAVSLIAAAESSPSPQPAVTPEQYQQQDALVAKLKAQLAAETKKLDDMKAASSDSKEKLQKATSVAANEDAILFAKDAASFFPVKVRKTVLGDKESLDPASLSYLKNNNGKDTYSIDVGALWSPEALALPTLDALDWAAFDYIQLSPFAEYHRNTASSALNDTLILGGNARLTLDRGDQLADFFQYIDLSGGWKDVALTEGKSVFAQLQYTPLMRAWHLGLFGDSRLAMNQSEGVQTSEWDQLRFVPTVALAYQHVYEGLLPANEGDNLVLKASAAVEYFPKRWMFGALQDKLALRAGYTFWSYLTHTPAVSVPDRNMSYFHASADFYIDGYRPGPSDPSTGKDGHFAVGLEYTRGDNPDTGAFDVDQWLLSFRVFF